MSKLILIGLVVAWAVMLAPDMFRFISRGRRGDTMRSFSSQITSLGSMNRSARQNSIDSMARQVTADQSLRRPLVPAPIVGSPPAVQQRSSSRTSSQGAQVNRRPRPAQSAGVQKSRVDPRRRRQDVLVVLGAAAILTLLATVAFGGVFLVLHLVVDVALIAYLVALAQVLNIFGNNAARTQPAHGPARRTLARHSDGRIQPVLRPAQRLVPQTVRSQAAVGQPVAQPIPVTARHSAR